MLGFEQAATCAEPINDEEYQQFLHRHTVPHHTSAISFIYTETSGCSHSKGQKDDDFVLQKNNFTAQADKLHHIDQNNDDDSDLLSSCSFHSSGEDSLSEHKSTPSIDDSGSDDEMSFTTTSQTLGTSIDSNYSSSSLLHNQVLSQKSFPQDSEMQTVLRWYGVFLPEHNTLYLESPTSFQVHRDSLVNILDIVESMGCFNVILLVPKRRTDLVKQYLFAGFEITKSLGSSMRTPASIHGTQNCDLHRGSASEAAACQQTGYITLSYEM